MARTDKDFYLAEVMNYKLGGSFSGNVKGMGPGVAELEFEERPNEAFTVFAADKTEPGAFNYPIYRMFVDTLSNTALIVNKSLASGVVMNIMDVEKAQIASLRLWEDKPTIEAALMYPGRYVVDSVYTKEGEPILDSDSYTFNEDLTVEDFIVIDTSSYYIETFQGLDSNEDQRANPRIFRFIKDGYFYKDNKYVDLFIRPKLSSSKYDYLQITISPSDKKYIIKDKSKEKTFFKNCIKPKDILPKKNWYKKFDKYWIISETNSKKIAPVNDTKKITKDQASIKETEENAVVQLTGEDLRISRLSEEELGNEALALFNEMHFEDAKQLYERHKQLNQK